MRVLTLEGFSKTLIKRGDLTEAAIADLFESCATDVFAKWDESDVSVAIENADIQEYLGLETFSAEENNFISDYLLSEESAFDAIAVLQNFEDMTQADQGYNWSALDTAMIGAEESVYTVEEFKSFVQEAHNAYLAQEKN